MHLQTRHLTTHRRARLLAWTLAMLTWLSSVLFSGAAFTGRHERRRGERMSLAFLARRVMLLLICRAGDFARVRQRPAVMACYGRAQPKHLLRALISWRVRRVMRGDGFASRIHALIHLIKYIDNYAWLIAKRLRRGLNRLFARIPAPHAAAPLVALAAAPIFLADSS